ncbi:hypothetical protein C8F04DRAFT_1209089 [Mycena alexandri]|uniref:DUF4246 domain-containing protein n=1 Tax=Mycena alexandri TaxID=1745969 RepID=A0AAD6T593_9AGAR|nr:hypothetical protein C8F04DRAFT_1209089 [Mycena alexandri]
MASASGDDEGTPVERYFHPFHENPWDDDDEHSTPGTWPPKTLAELRIKPLWWEKFRDEPIRKKWIQEVKEQQVDLKPYERLTDNMVNYVVAELEGYAKLRDQKTGIECGPYERIFFSDILVPADVTTALRLAVKPLEDIPDDKKDWHPGSDGRVLDLVHPSLCPVIFDVTWGTQSNGELGTFENPDADELNVGYMFVSERFQWLPSDFEVGESGGVKLKSPYINNIYPEHHDALVPVIERVMECAVPLWERVLSALRRDPVPARVRHTLKSEEWNSEDLPCIWFNNDRHPDNSEEEREQEHDYAAWHERRLIRGPLCLPDAPELYEDALKEDMAVSLLGSTIQVIVKLANIHVSPGDEYPGGKWHVEGMATESIVSTFIYYFHSENIEPVDLNFRMATQAPQPHQQDDSSCMEILYGIRRDNACAQDIGSVKTRADRCIAFPNLYQHQVSPFKLVDKTKPGVRKILVLFLVDPAVNVISATNVPPQQLEVVKHILRSQGPSSRLSLLPIELLDHIAEHVPGVQSRAEAEAVRVELMQERSVMIESVDKEFFSREFNMW